jgi:cytoskeletal protein CcmA (bactofilin family)
MIGKKQRRPEAEEKILDVNASMQGNMIFKDPVNLKINGTFEGTLTTKGNLTIGESAEVKADIIGENIVIAGKVTGDIIAWQDAAKYYGRIKTVEGTKYVWKLTTLLLVPGSLKESLAGVMSA